MKRKGEERRESGVEKGKNECFICFFYYKKESNRIVDFRLFSIWDIKLLDIVWRGDEVVF